MSAKAEFLRDLAAVFEKHDAKLDDREVEFCKNGKYSYLTVYFSNASEIRATADEIEKQEEGGARCPHCLKEDCECSEADINSNFGDK